MKSIIRIPLILLISNLTFFACDEDNEVVPPEDNRFNHGVLVLNEGNFGQPNGSLSFYDQDSSIMHDNVYETANNEATIGATLISAAFHDETGIILTNAPDKIELVDPKDFTALKSPITGTEVVQPRYVAVDGNRALITFWGAWGPNWTLPNSYVAELDLETLEITDQFETGDGAEGLLIYADKIFVANGYSDQVEVFNKQDFSFINSIEVPFAPTEMVIDRDNRIWVVSKGTFGGNGALVQIDPVNEVVLKTLEISGDSPSGKLAIDVNGENLYLITTEGFPGTGSSVYEVPVSATVFPSAPLINGNNYYGLGVDAIKRGAPRSMRCVFASLPVRSG